MIHLLALLLMFYGAVYEGGVDQLSGEIAKELLDKNLISNVVVLTFDDDGKIIDQKGFFEQDKHYIQLTYQDSSLKGISLNQQQIIRLLQGYGDQAMAKKMLYLVPDAEEPVVQLTVLWQDEFLYLPSTTDDLVSRLNEFGFATFVPFEPSGPFNSTANYVAALRKSTDAISSDLLFQMLLSKRNDRLHGVGLLFYKENRNLSTFSIDLKMETDIEFQLLWDEKEEIVGAEYLVVPLDKLPLSMISYTERNRNYLALVFQEELKIVELTRQRVREHLNISFDQLPPSEYVSRIPTAQIQAADVNHDGQEELMIASNLWKNGLIVFPADNYAFEYTLHHPLAVLSGQSDPDIVFADYQEGENSFGNTYLVRKKLETTNRVYEREEYTSLAGLSHKRLLARTLGDRYLLLNEKLELEAELETNQENSVFTIWKSDEQIYLIIAGDDQHDIAQDNTDQFGELISIYRLVNDGLVRTTSFRSELDIVSMTVYNSRGNTNELLAVAGRNITGNYSLRFLKLTK